MLCVVADLDAIRHQLARQQAVTSAGSALGKRIRDGRCTDEQALSAALTDHFHQQICQPPHTIVAAMRVGVGARDRDDGIALRSVARIEAGRAQFDRTQADGIVPVTGIGVRHGD